MTEAENVFIHRAMYLRFPGVVIAGLVMREADGPWTVSVTQSYEDGSPEDHDCFEGPDGSDGCRDDGVKRLRVFIVSTGLLAKAKGVPHDSIDAGDMLIDGDQATLHAIMKKCLAKQVAAVVVPFPISEPAEA